MKDLGKILIVGAGPTGLGAAYRLLELGFTDFSIIERETHPGGLASSVVDPEGFTWDLGGHVQFSHYGYYDKVLDRAVEHWLFHERESWIWMKDRFIPYPFQYNIRHLDVPDRQAILRGLRDVTKRDGTAPPSNFKDWILRTFGVELAETFFFPYNWKVWGYPLDTLDIGWMGERIAIPDIDRIEQNIAEGKDDVSWGPNNRFRFPAQGGTGAIWQGVSKLIPERHFRFRSAVARIDCLHRWLDTDGDRLAYDKLISTIPIDALCSLTGGLPGQACIAAHHIIHSSVHIIGIGLKGTPPAALKSKCWMYFPESHSPYYRVTVFSNYSPQNVPNPSCNWSLMAEVCETPAKPVEAAGLCEWAIRAMRTDRLIPRESDIVSIWHRRLEYGYPTPFLGRDKILRSIQNELERQSIFSRGRFGAWKYEVSNQDHSFMQGVELADRLLLGQAEVTV